MAVTNPNRIVLDILQPDSLQEGAEKINDSFDFYDQKLTSQEDLQTSIWNYITLVETEVGENERQLMQHEERITNAEGTLTTTTATANVAKQKADANAVTLANLTRRPLYTIRSDKDENGIFRRIEYRRSVDGILVRSTVLSELDDEGRYTKRTVRVLGDDGKYYEYIRTLRYDADGDFEREDP